MAPTKEGSYEFDKDSLAEFRKSMGISQSKMAELLGVPANTLSRWETGATVPDAGSLAAVYSIAKERGMPPPSFFTMRTPPLELSLGSHSSHEAADSLAFRASLRSYLNTQITQTGTELAPGIRVEIRNTAPKGTDWPRVVFIGVALSVAGIEQGWALRAPAPGGVRMIRTEEDKARETVAATPWQYDSKVIGELTPAYNYLFGKGGGGDVELAERERGEMLFPGQSIVYSIAVKPEQLPYLQFRAEGNVSSHHLFHCEETFIMPEALARPLALAAVTDFKAMDVYGPLKAVINVMPKFDNDTRFSEVQTFSSTLSTSIEKIKVTQKDGSNAYNHHRLPRFRAHLRATYIHLERVGAALARMKEAIESNVSDRMSVEGGAIKALEAEAAQLDRETQEFMRTYNILDEEVKRHQAGAIELAPGAAQFKNESPATVAPDIPDELDLHGKTVEESISLVDRYLEDSYNANRRRVWIVHGKGTGTLRQAVSQHLRGHRLVKSYALAESSRGGDGASQIEIID